MTAGRWLRKLFRPKARTVKTVIKRKEKHWARLAVEGLEERCLLSAASMALRQELVIIDAAVADRTALMSGIAPGIDVAVLDANQDGIRQLADLVAGRSSLDAVHIVSHGSQGALHLGNGTLTGGNLGAYASELAVLQSALAPGGDLLLYGCDVAAGPAGAAFVTDLARVTGADVAASTDLTGAAALGGDWDLEGHTGAVEAAVPFSAAARAEFAGTLDILAVAGRSTMIPQPADLFPHLGVIVTPTKGVLEVRPDDDPNAAWVQLKVDDHINYFNQVVRYRTAANVSGTDYFQLGPFGYNVIISPPSVPVITSQPQDQAVPYWSNTLADEGATLTVEATGAPTPTYQWYLGASGDTSRPIQHASGSSYHTPGLTEDTQYWVQVTNDLGTANSRTVTVDVQNRPRIVFQPNTPTIHYGQIAELGVYAVGTDLKYQWFLGQPGDTSNPVSGLQDDQAFDSAPLTETTAFWVRVSNADGQADSEAATVTVLFSPKVVRQAGHPEIDKGEGATLSVGVAGKPEFTFQWYQGQSGDTSMPVAGATGSTFATGAMDVSAAYWVRVTNDYGTADSETSYVAVVPLYEIVYGGAPARVVIQEPFGLRGHDGTNRTFTSPAYGNLYISGEPGGTDPGSLSIFPNSHGDTTIASTLREGYIIYGPRAGMTAFFDEFTIRDAGPDPITRRVRVAIHYPPGIASQPTGSTIATGQTATFTITASGPEPHQTPDLPLTYQVFQRGSGGAVTPVTSPQTSDALTFTWTTPVLTAAPGTRATPRYFVRVTNDYGTVDSQTVTIDVVGEPLITSQPQGQTIVVGTGTQLSVQAAPGPLMYQWYEGESGDTSRPVDGATQAVFTTPNLHVDTTYWVRATNIAGYVDSAAATVLVVTAPTLTAEPQDAAILVEQEFTLTVAADGRWLAYQWYEGESGDEDSPIHGATAATFTTDGLRATGTYWVRVSNAAGFVDSRTVTVTVDKWTPTVTWEDPTFVYGPWLTSVLFYDVIATATADAPGGFSYDLHGLRFDAQLDAGSYPLSATFDPYDPVKYESVTVDATLIVQKATPTVIWDDPRDIPYGAPLPQTSDSNFYNAWVVPRDLKGTFEYNPGPGTILPAGRHTLSVTFTPWDDDNYTSGTGTATLHVTGKSPFLFWPSPAAIPYGTPLGDAQLNARAIVDGTFTYSQPAGTVLDVGTHTLSVTFTPDDPAYEPASKDVTLTVTKVTPVLTWDDQAIVYGTPLGDAQLNATADVPGTFAYSPPAGIRLGAGAYTLFVTFTPADAAHYSSVTQTATLSVDKATPVVAVGSGTFTYDATAHAATATATGLDGSPVSGSFTFTYDGSATPPVNAGTYTVVAQFTSGDPNYADAVGTGTLVIDRATPTVHWANPADIGQGTPLSAAQLNATASVPGTFSYSPAVGTVLGAGSHTLSVAFTPDDAANYNGATATVTLLVAQATVAVGDVSVVEGDAGTSQAVFTVMVTGSGQPVTVQYATANGTATAGSDYTAVSGTLTFAPGASTQTVSVGVHGDALREGHETFFLNLTAAAGILVADGQGLATMLNDDSDVRLGDVAVVEGNGPATTLLLPVTLNVASALPVTVAYGTADNTAKAPADYTPVSGMLTFAPGETRKLLTIAVAGDVMDENSETFRVNLSAAVNAFLADGEGFVTILDDDAPPLVSISDATVVEASAGFVDLVFTVTLAAPSGKTVSVNLATAGDTATAGADYEATSGVLVFLAGVTQRTFTVRVKADALAEGDERLFVDLSSVANALLGTGRGNGTIRNA